MRQREQQPCARDLVSLDRKGNRLPVPVLGLDVVGEGLGILVDLVVVAVVAVFVVTVSVLERTDVVQLDDVTALAATLNGTFTGNLLALSVSISLVILTCRVVHTVSQLTW
jgi:hypothetical protein